MSRHVGAPVRRCCDHVCLNIVAPFSFFLSAVSDSQGSFLHFPELDVRIHKPAYAAVTARVCAHIHVCVPGGNERRLFPWSSCPLKEPALLLIGVDLTNSHMGAPLLFWLH